ncbi:SbmA/BacA-like family protein [Cryptosporidium muris RN66]|uniref:SbmA/BacA-like family protein n=1 Tax=Cryptosporidium muris (strain RN66) TaxID=441375 RepID=B6AF80_CRYMR|nr:SbmA/BacA-like family protein [Cryptosporidium muris RN66]EEA06871.1 SbmA/BacA-like family protein [Cryptosporidium muris RN66]|eukprot:XP_002141220.1 SbmA/BacA-like family protein [Cryptosporidium muris RN66]
MFSQFFKNRDYIFWAYFGWILVIILCLAECFFDTLSNHLNQAFANYIQGALNPTDNTYKPTRQDFIIYLWGLLWVELIGVALTNSGREFIGQHIAFKWRMALNDCYISKWPILKDIEGVSQRIQEDCRDFASKVELLAVDLIYKIVKAFTFYRLILIYGKMISYIPFFGSNSHSLLFASIFAEGLCYIPLIISGRKLPKIEYDNQVVEAAYRKELVLSEDDHFTTVNMITISTLFSKVRSNSLLMYRHLMYVDAAFKFTNTSSRYISVIILIPPLLRKELDFGSFKAADSVINNMLWILSSIREKWPILIELASIHKRLKGLDHYIEINNKNSHYLDEIDNNNNKVLINIEYKNM